MEDMDKCSQKGGKLIGDYQRNHHYNIGFDIRMGYNAIFYRRSHWIRFRNVINGFISYPYQANSNGWFDIRRGILAGA